MNLTNDRPWISRSFAKINLGLHIFEKLSNGYHLIETGFCFINWSDRFEMRKSSHFQLRMSDPGLPVDENNLIVKAAQALRRYLLFEDAYSVFVEKKIPAGAGLGGGSSNAATILHMLNKASNMNISRDDMARFLSDTGADIPFFIYGKTGIGSGIGGNLTFCDIQPDAWILTIFPNIHVSTADAYKDCIPEQNPDFSLSHVLQNEPLEEWRHLLTNGLEPPVILRHPAIGDIKDQLYELGAVYAAMSGSGSAVFGIFDQEFVALDAYNRFLDWKFTANLTPPSFKPDLGVYQHC